MAGPLYFVLAFYSARPDPSDASGQRAANRNARHAEGFFSVSLSLPMHLATTPRYSALYGRYGDLGAHAAAF